MSSELMALLKRTQPEPSKPNYRKVSPEASPYLAALMGRMAAREWRDDQLVLAVEYLKQSAGEIDFIKHLKTCYECRMEAELSIERHGGRCLPWFLDLINDPYECGDFQNGNEDPYPGRPHTEDYRIGSYWEDVENMRQGIEGKPKETWKFIEARCQWAEKIIKQQIMMAVTYYKLLKEWDLSGEYPIESNLPFSY